MPRSNRKSHSRGGSFKRNVTYTQSNPEVKLTKEQLAEDARDQKKILHASGRIDFIDTHNCVSALFP